MNGQGRVQEGNPSDLFGRILLKGGDLSALTPGEKVSYAAELSRRLSLDPLAQPFRLLKIDRREILYCTKAGAEQLNRIHEISHEIREREERRDIYTVYSRAVLPGGRFVDSSGSVAVAGLEREPLANAMMTAETKSKRRATLSLLGLGLLSEEEALTVPGAVVEPLPCGERDGERKVDAVPPERPYGDEEFPLGPYRGMTLEQLLASKGENQVAGGVAWLEHQGMHGEFTRRARAFLEWRNDAVAIDEPVKGEKVP
jgi:hypothetical protein